MEAKRTKRVFVHKVGLTLFHVRATRSLNERRNKCFEPHICTGPQMIPEPQIISFAVQFGDRLRFWDHLWTRTYLLVEDCNLSCFTCHFNVIKGKPLCH